MPDKNYTPEQELKLREVYQPEDTQEERDEQVAELANEMDKKVRSIVAKLSRMGIYVAKVRVTKSGEAVEHKKDIVADIAKAVGAATGSFASFSKATKADLQAFSKALTSD
jgi:3-hydroxyacyl-CoA dehydrogenase